MAVGGKATINDENRFDRDAGRYATYLDTPEGRLRADLTFANLQEFFPAPDRMRSLCAVDLGCGTGGASLSLARLGVSVTLIDASQAMLGLAESAIVSAGLRDRTELRCGDLAQLPAIFPERSFDIILCHNVLEYVDDPAAVLRCAVRLLRDSSALLSILVRNQAGEVLKAAINIGDLAAAENNLSTEWVQESLYGGQVRLFTPDGLEAMLRDASIKVVARRGVRAVADYLHAQISRSAEYDRIFALERRLSVRSEFIGVARYIQYLAGSGSYVQKGNK